MDTLGIANEFIGNSEHRLTGKHRNGGTEMGTGMEIGNRNVGTKTETSCYYECLSLALLSDSELE